jgi:hypothetical protein
MHTYHHEKFFFQEFSKSAFRDNYFGTLKKRQKHTKNPKTHYEKKVKKKFFNIFKCGENANFQDFAAFKSEIHKKN